MSSSIVTSSLKALAMADSSYSTLFSLPFIVNISSCKPRRSSFSFSTRPINLPLSLKSRTHHNLSPVATFVAQTSDWAEEEGEDGSIGGASIAVEENEESLEPEAKLWEGEGDTSGTEEDGGEFQEPPEEAKLFVGNLPYDVDSQALAMLFEQAGTVEISEVIYNRDTDQSRGFGFVTMSTVEEAEKAVEKFNRYEVNGRLLTVNIAAPRGSRPERQPRVYEAAFRIYVGNLPWDVDNGRLEQVFSEHGEVVEARVVYDRETGRTRGFGFVTMSNEAEVNEAIAALDGKEVDGRLLTVNIAAPIGSRPERQPPVYEAAFRIYVGNLPWDVDSGRLEQVFSEHGKVVEARVVYDRETGRSRGFGFVTMSNEAEVNDAIAALDGQNLEGRAIRVNAAEERPRRGF